MPSGGIDPKDSQEVSLRKRETPRLRGGVALLPVGVTVVTVAGFFLAALPAHAQQKSTVSTELRAAVSELPDWGGIWIPDVAQQRKSFLANETPWKPEVAKVVRGMLDSKAVGDPYGLFLDCLPLGMPSLILGTHNPIEFLFTPGRITMLGEADGNRLRRIYTDGRAFPDDPEPTYHGYSVGRWTGEKLVIDTIGFLSEVYIAPDGENIGVRNGGDMRIREEVYLADPNTLRFDLEITAPHVLTAPWRTSRFFRRMRGPNAEIIEGVCLQANWNDKVDEDGKTKFEPVPRSERNKR